MTVAGDLTTFARDIVAAAAHEDIKAAIMSGRVLFAPAGGEGGPARKTPDNPVAGGIPRIAEGIVTEHKVIEIGRTHNRLVIGPEVAVTPLARDKAREIKIEIVRRSHEDRNRHRKGLGDEAARRAAGRGAARDRDGGGPASG